MTTARRGEIAYVPEAGGLGGVTILTIDQRNQQVVYQGAMNNQKDTNMSEIPSIGLDLLGNLK